MPGCDEEGLAERLRARPPPPAAWVQAAQELPRARRELGGIVARAEADAAYRAAVLADLEGALADAGLEPHPPAVGGVRRRARRTPGGPPRRGPGGRAATTSARRCSRGPCPGPPSCRSRSPRPRRT